jgi:CCR4-NOT transcription complex subunit 4
MASREDPIPKPLSRIVPTSTAFTPSRIVSSAYIPRAATPLANVSVPTTPVQRVATPRLADLTTMQAKQEVRSLAVNSGLSNVIASQAPVPTTHHMLLPEDFPSLDKGKGKEVTTTPSGPNITTPVVKKAIPAVPSPAVQSPSSTIKTPSKRPVPGILNISPAIQSPVKSAPLSETPVKTTSTANAFPPLPPSTPAARAPKTLRVVPTPRTENPPMTTSNPASAVSAFPPAFPPTRQPGLASVSKLDRPSTPASEIISDNTSIGSASISRPGSPPQSRIGSAPVRTTTKSQQKKQRKEKSELTTLVDRPEPVEIAPIVGRKKKQKKEKQSSAAGSSTPAISRPPSPGPQQVTEPAKQSKQESVPEMKATIPAKPVVAEVMPTVNEKKIKGKAKLEKVEKEEIIVPEAVAPPAEVVEDVVEKSIPTPSSILQDLVLSGVLPDPNNLIVLKPPMGFNQRSDYSGDLQGFDGKLTITEEDRATLASGRPVHKNVEGSYRMMLTPNGDCVRNLTPAEEERYLELQARIFEEAGPAAFVPARHNAGSGFTLIGGRAVPNGPPAFFPPNDNSPLVVSMDPVSKIQRDEALSYINQYVLPSLSQNSQLERALNAWGPEMAQAQYSQSRGDWGVLNGHDALSNQGEHQNEADTPYGTNVQNEGILATGLESMTSHFAVGRDNGRGQSLGKVTLLSLSDSESAMQSAKKETEKLEKSLNQLLKKNRRLLLGAAH